MKMSKMACLGALILMPFMGLAQDAGIDLWDTWRQGFEKYEAAENAFKKKNMSSALRLYRESQEIFQKIKKASPGWNAEVVAYRISLCSRKINEIDAPRRKAVAENQQKNEISRLRKENETLQKQLRQTRVELIDAKSAAERNALSEKQVKKLMSEIVALERNIAARDATISSLKTDLVKADKSAQYNRLLLKAKTDMEKMNLVQAELRKDLAFAKERARKFQEQRNKTESKLYRLEAQVKDLDARKREISVLSSENKKLADALNRSVLLQKETERTVANLKEGNKVLQDKINALESGKIVLSSEKKLQSDLASEKKKNDELIVSMKKSLQQNKQIQAELEKLRDSNKKLILDLVRSTENIAKLRSDYAALMKISDDQKKQIRTGEVLAEENTKLKKDIADIAKKYEEFRISSKNNYDEKIKELTAQLENARVNYQYSVERLRQAENNAKSSAGKLQQTIARLEEEKNVLRQTAELSKQNLQTVKRSLEKISLEHDALKKEFDKLNRMKKTESVKVVQTGIPEKVKKELEEKIAVLAGEKERLQKENNKYQEQVSALEKLTRENNKYREQVSALEKLSRENSKNHELAAALEKLTKENVEYREQIASLKKLMKENSKDHERIALIDKLSQENRKYREQVASLDKLTKENAAYREQVASLDKLTKENAAYREQVASLDKLTQENRKYREQLSELDRLMKENAKYRVQLASFEKLKQENKELLSNRESANAEIAKKSADRLKDLEKISQLTEKVNKQEADLAEAKEQLNKKNRELASASKNMSDTAVLLKKQLMDVQESETKVRKELALLKMEYSDLEKKLTGTVPEDTLKNVKNQLETRNKEVAELRTAKAKTDAALKSAEDLVQFYRKQVDVYAKNNTEDSKKQIARLTAAVAELQEAKIQYETLLREQKSKLDSLKEENKELSLANTAFQTQVAELKVKPEEYRKNIENLQDRNRNLLNLQKKYEAQTAQLREDVKLREQKIEKLNNDMKEREVLIARYRKELKDWGELPQGDLTEELSRKKLAIDELVRETAELRKEKDMLKTELTLSKDHVVKYKRLAMDIETNLMMTRAVLARLKNALARHTSAVEVENLIKEQFKIQEGSFGPAASVETIQKEVAQIKKADAPKYTEKELAERAKAYKTAMERGAKAEKAKQYSDALIHYWRATEFNSENGEVHKALARIYLIRRDFANARDHYKTAVQKFKMSRDPAFEEKLVVLAQEVLDSGTIQKNLNRMKKDTSEGSDK